MLQKIYKITQTHKLIKSIIGQYANSYHNNPLQFLKPLETPITYWFVFDIQNGLGNLYDSNKKMIEQYNYINDNINEKGYVWTSDCVIPIPDNSIYRFSNFNPYKKIFKICENNKFICEMNGSGMYMIQVMYGEYNEVKNLDEAFDFHLKYSNKKNQISKSNFNTKNLFGI
jgi:hypothetical protein